jgi:hypothetical protein
MASYCFAGVDRRPRHSEDGVAYSASPNAEPGVARGLASV